jgi:DNA-binding CsgD family transcriptional regulator/tetratricopeptide (TPR) repeat protein
VRAVADDDVAALTPRRREILAHLARGLTNEDIAAELGISPATVRTHLTGLFAALGVQNRTEAAARWHAWSNHAGSVQAVAHVLARPAIAVLPPLTDESPGANGLASALTHELNALFARWCWFPVIARSSVVGARSAGVTAPAIGKALGARFLVDPFLRAHRGGWRLSIQVDDVVDGYCLWVERYDFEQQPFAALDDICAEIVSRAYPVLMARINGQFRDGPRAGDIEAWELAHRAVELQAQRDRAGHDGAVALCQQALARDPTLVMAHHVLGLCAYDAILNQWDDAERGRERLVAAADACIGHAPHAAEGWFLLGRYHQTLGDHPSAIIALETAIARNPSYSPAHALLAQALMLCGRGDDALVRMEHALRLGPRSWVAGLATLHFAAGRFADATELAERAVALTPQYPFARVLAAASAWCVGDRLRAIGHFEQMRLTCPGFEPDAFLATFGADVAAVHRLSQAVHAIRAAVGEVASLAG